MRKIKLFIQSAGALLLASALIRFLIAVGSDPVLSLPEPMLGLPLRYTLLLLGGFELTVALICLSSKRPGFQLVWIAWVSSNYQVYWIGLKMMDYAPQTSCIGSVTDPLQLSRGNLSLVLSFLPLYFLLGSCIGLLWLWRESRRAKASIFHKMACPACGIHIRFDEHNLGQRFPCPQCFTDIIIRKPQLLKTVCFFCQEHIEFPSHAIGEKIKCPHCCKDITLKEMEA
jgi:predicted RNA-binding Zn-ribbon protein involved in translation (DUF1610 family)